MFTQGALERSERITDMSGVELARAVRQRVLSPVEIVNSLLERIDQVNPQINAFITVAHDFARDAAKRAEREVMTLDADSLGPLHGVPVTVKDLTPTAGVRTTLGVVPLRDHIPHEDGVTWARLKAAGAILLGKTSTPPLGSLCITENDLIGRTNNPFDLGRTVGGSSGGAAAALAVGLGPMAIGSDGGGSIRVPASYCGVVGLKPSLGRIPLYSEGEIYETVDVVGPMARCVEDVAQMLAIMSGPHPRDPFSLPADNTDYMAVIENLDVRDVRIALSMDLGRGPVERDVAAAVTTTANIIEQVLGCSVSPVDIALPDFADYYRDYWEPYFALYMKYEERYDLGRYKPLVEGIARGSKVSAVDHIRTAQVRRAEIHEALADVLEEHDVLITPTTPQTAFPHPDPDLLGPAVVAGVEVSMPAIDFARLTDPISNAGYPAITIPCGLTAEGLPVGLQIVGRHHADAEVLRVAASIEKALEPHLMKPVRIPVAAPNI